MYLTGDTHCSEIRRLNTGNFPQQRQMTKNDVVIALGDFGLLWKNEESKEELWWKRWLNEKNFTTCFLDGNHENFYRINNLPIIDKFEGKVGEYSNSIFHLRRGEVYIIEGKKIFCFGGAASTDKIKRLVDIDWWAAEEATYAEQEYALSNLEKHNFEVDYIFAHTAPTSIIEKAFSEYDTGKIDATARFLEHVIQVTKFKEYFCGHFHEDLDFENYHFLYDRIKQI
jgi:hypothetical protein